MPHNSLCPPLPPPPKKKNIYIYFFEMLLGGLHITKGITQQQFMQNLGATSGGQTL